MVCKNAVALAFYGVLAIQLKFVTSYLLTSTVHVCELRTKYNASIWVRDQLYCSKQQFFSSFLRLGVHSGAELKRGLTPQYTWRVLRVSLGGMTRLILSYSASVASCHAHQHLQLT